VALGFSGGGLPARFTVGDNCGMRDQPTLHPPHLAGLSYDLAGTGIFSPIVKNCSGLIFRVLEERKFFRVQYMCSYIHVFKQVDRHVSGIPLKLLTCHDYLSGSRSIIRTTGRCLLRPTVD